MDLILRNIMMPGLTGCMLFEMLTGRLAFVPEQQDPMAMVTMHIAADAPSPRQVNPELPAAIEQVVLQTLRKDPKQRPSPEELAWSFAQAAGLPAELVGAVPPGPPWYSRIGIPKRPAMPVTKFAISVPAEVMRAVDRAARARQVTRSRLVSEVLARIARAARDEDISRRVDEALSDPELAAEQRATAAAYRRIRPRRGTAW